MCYVISYFCSIGCRIVNWVTADGCVHITESVGSRRELVANSCIVHTADADATQLDSFAPSAAPVCIGHKINVKIRNYTKCRAVSAWHPNFLYVSVYVAFYFSLAVVTVKCCKRHR